MVRERAVVRDAHRAELVTHELHAPLDLLLIWVAKVVDVLARQALRRVQHVRRPPRIARQRGKRIGDALGSRLQEAGSVVPSGHD